MKILVVTQYFQPENFKSNDIAFELSRRGHDVTVLTGIPNYPQGKFYKGYGILKKRHERINGVSIYRAFLIPRGKGGGVMLALNYLSWAFIASIWAFFMALFRKYDAVFVHETSPITQGYPALVVRAMCHCPMYFWVLDLWPESLQAAGGINKKHILGIFTRMTRQMYRESEKILISSNGFRESILAKGDYENKIEYFPNWAESVFENPSWVRPDMKLPCLPEGFRVMFTGNVGEAQDFEQVIRAAELLKDYKNIKFLIVGDGRKRQWVTDAIKDKDLEDTVFWLGRYPLDYIPAISNDADVLFLSLKSDLIFRLTVPAKLQSYMATGKPIVAMIDGEAQNIVKEAGCGLCADAGDAKSFADNILKMSKFPKEKLAAMGKAGLEYYDKYFRKAVCFDRLYNLIEK